MTPVTIQEAKERVKIHDLWRIFNLPGDCKKNPCHSPFYEPDGKPSFSVSVGGDLFNDFRTGDKGDQITFVSLYFQCSNKEACKRFIELAGGTAGQPLRSGPALLARPKPEARPLPTLPSMRRGTPEELATLAALRNVHIEAVKVADSAGVLRFGQFMELPSWFVVDPSGHVAQARRLDGQPWPSGTKAHTCAGSWASWPVGTGLGEYQTILFCEGGPDALAAIHFGYIHGLGVFGIVAMLGAGQKIHPEALPLFAGKRVRIYNHGDEPGRKAARRWAAQLATVGCQVDAIDCGGFKMSNGAVSNDLNDLVLVNPSELKGLLPDA